MKILFDHAMPFSLAHGGLQTQVEETKKALELAGVDVEWLRWWDTSQNGDLIHYFGVPPRSYLNQAAIKKIPVVLTHLLTETCNRSDLQLKIQGIVTRALLAIPGWGIIKNQLTWSSLIAAQRVIVGLQAEKHALQAIFRIPEERIAVVPLGLAEQFLQCRNSRRDSDYLVTTGTITERKRAVELAKMAKLAQVPLLFVGKAYSEVEPYWHQFRSLIDGKFVRHRLHVAGTEEMIGILERARGFVIFSRYENWCLSAHEAAACGLPLLLPDQKWSRERFGNSPAFLLPYDSKENTKRLKDFYENCSRLSPAKAKLWSWKEVAAQLKSVYSEVLIQE